MYIPRVWTIDWRANDFTNKQHLTMERAEHIKRHDNYVHMHWKRPQHNLLYLPSLCDWSVVSIQCVCLSIIRHIHCSVHHPKHVLLLYNLYVVSYERVIPRGSQVSVHHRDKQRWLGTTGIVYTIAVWDNVISKKIKFRVNNDTTKALFSFFIYFIFF